MPDCYLPCQGSGRTWELTMLARQVYLPPVEPDALLADVKGLQQEGAAKAFVDDTYLGYQSLGLLAATLQHFQREVQPLAQALRDSRWMCAPHVPPL